MENDEEYDHLPREFCYPEDRSDENSDEINVEASSTAESQEQKRANT